jgi:hypothetical protein
VADELYDLITGGPVPEWATQMMDRRLMTDNTKELAALSEAATPGEWAVEQPMDMELLIVEAGRQVYEWRTIAGCPLPGETFDIPRKQVTANAALIVYAINAIRSGDLVPRAEVDRARAEGAAKIKRFREAGSVILERMSSTYTARNGREVGIQGDDGEKVWLVHSDDIENLRAALSDTPDAG